MPRDPSGNYAYPPGTEGVSDETIESAKYNAYIADVQTDLNTARPIVAGGTGATSAAAARINLSTMLSSVQVTNYDSHVFEGGGFWSYGGATGAPSATGSNILSGVAVVFNNDQNTITLRATDHITGLTYTRAKWAGIWGAWVVDGSDRVAKVGDTMTGALTLPAGNPTAPLHAAHKQYVDSNSAASGAVLRIGDTMTGPLTLPAGDPTAPLHAAHKQYVDKAIAAMVGSGSELRFTRSLFQHMYRGFTTTSSQAWTMSMWVKRVGLGTHQALFGTENPGNKLHVAFQPDNSLGVYGGPAGDIVIVGPMPPQTDTTLWLNIVWSVPAGAPSAAKFHTIDVNNEPAWRIGALISGNGVNAAETHYIGQSPYFPDVIMKDVVFVDGTQLPPTSFGESITGVWKPKAYPGPFGTNGFKLFFRPENLGADATTNNNNWVPGNFP